MTIAVIMILAGISINAIVGDDGLIKKAQKSADLSNEAEAKETINRAILEFYTSREYATLYDFLQTKVEKGTIDKVDKNSDGTLTISKNGYTVNSENKTQTTSKNNGSGAGENTGGTSGSTSGSTSEGASGGTGGNTSGSTSGSASGSTSGGTSGSTSGGTSTNVPATATAETAPYFPDSTFTKKEGTIDTGLVIQDTAGNEYVWVIVPKTLYDNTTYNSNGSKKPSSSTDYENIEYCLKQYTSTYRKSGWTDTYSADSNNEGWFADETAYNTAKNNMLKSVYENGGFYVGRYEAGIETTGINRTNSSSKNSNGKYDITGMSTPVTKANAYPYTYVTRTQAQNLAKSLSTGKSYTSSLMYGVQWDLVLAFMSKDSSKISSDLSELTSDSTSIGNYKNNLWTITNVKAQYLSKGTFIACPNPFEKESSSSILLTTGADSSFSVQNIYDIAGNVEEWTLEKASSTTYPCVYRGGSNSNTGSYTTASGHYNDLKTHSNVGIGFRVSLF